MVSNGSDSRLTVITGPSGVGKGTVVKQLLQKHKKVWLSVSATTRLPRKGEIEGEDYFFLGKDSFNELANKEGFLEWAEFAGNSYGTPRKPIQQKLDSGVNVLLEIELEGARQVRRSFPQAFQIFLAPPSFQELERRIRNRGTDSEKAIEARLKRAKEELEAQAEFDAIVINEDLNKSVFDLEVLLGLVS